jgi:CRISPR-associated endonuclease Cas1
MSASAIDKPKESASGSVLTTYTRSSSDPRVLVVDGYGVTITVRRGHLVLNDGIGRHRRERTLARIERTARRILVLGESGYLSWEAARWCLDVGIAVVQIDDTGRLITLTSTAGLDDARLRRAQAFAGEGGPHESTGLDIAKHLLSRKLAGQAEIAEKLLRNPGIAAVIREHAEDLAGCATVRAASGSEAGAAAAYWRAWSGNVVVPFTPSQVGTVPAHWTTFVARNSPIDTASGNARHAADPINALLNYGYRLAEIERRLACLAVGLDPGMGFLHADKQNRDSLALDLLEVARPAVERFVLDVLSTNGSLNYLSPKLFAESRDGGCRLVAPLTHMIAEQTLSWAAAIAPHTEHVAHMLANLGRGEIRPARPLTTDKTLTRRSRATPAKLRRLPGVVRNTNETRAKPLRLPGPVTVERIIPDDLWDTVAPMLPPNPRHPRGGRSFLDNRTVLAGIVCVELLDCSLAKIPPVLGVSRYTCKARLDSWRANGVRAAVRRVLAESDHVQGLATVTSAPGG